MRGPAWDQTFQSISFRSVVLLRCMLEMKINFCRLITFAALFGTLSFLRAQEPPTPTIATYAGLTFTEANSGHWTIEATSDLSRDGGWSVVADKVFVQGGTPTLWLDPTPIQDAAQRFYRVVAPAPPSTWVGTKQLGAADQITFGNALATDSGGNVYVAGSTKGGLDGNTLTGTYDFYLSKYSSSGVRLYTKQLGVAGRDTVATAVATDANDNVYVAGYTTGGLYGNTMQQDSTHEVFISKYDSNGVKQFTRQLGVAGEKKVGIAVAIDANGNIFVAGYTTGALDGYTMTGTVDSFFSKYNSEGVKQFTRLLGVAGKETRGYGVATDASGNVFVAGYTEGALDGNALTGTRDFFVAKYDPSGVKQFTRQLGAVGGVTVGTAVTTDDKGDVFVVGYTEGSLDGNTLTGTRDFFVAKYDPSGVKQFTRQLGAVGAVTVGNEVATDLVGDVFVTGSTTGGLDGNARTGIHDVFVTKYTPNGVKLFTRQLGVAGRETYGNGVATDPIGDVFVAGSTSGGLDGNVQTGVYDFFVSKFDPDGVKQ